MDEQERVQELEKKIRRLKTEYDKYFLGTEKVAPERLASEVAREVKVLTATRLTNTALRFRLQQAISKYNTFQQFWTRRMAEVEEGRVPRKKQILTPSTGPRVSPGGEGRPFILSSSDPDPFPMESLLAKLKGEYAIQGTFLDPEKMKKALENQTKAIQQKYGVSKVSYRVVTEEGKVKVKAIPVKDEG